MQSIVCWLFSKVSFFKILFQEHYCSLKRFESRSLSVLIWVQTIFKCYQQMTKVVAGRERVKLSRLLKFIVANHNTNLFVLFNCFFFSEMKMCLFVAL